MAAFAQIDINSTHRIDWLHHRTVGTMRATQNRVSQKCSRTTGLDDVEDEHDDQNHHKNSPHDHQRNRGGVALSGSTLRRVHLEAVDPAGADLVGGQLQQPGDVVERDQRLGADGHPHLAALPVLEDQIYRDGGVPR